MGERTETPRTDEERAKAWLCDWMTTPYEAHEPASVRLLVALLTEVRAEEGERIREHAWQCLEPHEHRNLANAILCTRKTSEMPDNDKAVTDRANGSGLTVHPNSTPAGGSEGAGAVPRTAEAPIGEARCAKCGCSIPKPHCWECVFETSGKPITSRRDGDVQHVIHHVVCDAHEGWTPPAPVTSTPCTEPYTGAPWVTRVKPAEQCRESPQVTPDELRRIANDLIDAIATPQGRDFRHAWEAACLLFGRFGAEPTLLAELTALRAVAEAVQVWVDQLDGSKEEEMAQVGAFVALKAWRKLSSGAGGGR